ncbi:hypothetical protein EGN72_02075 [Pseudorhodobacter sp. E13]|nr:hypothetical protein EGN72_02075 [Pseudorhodobacter sp. E13]
MRVAGLALLLAGCQTAPAPEIPLQGAYIRMLQGHDGVNFAHVTIFPDDRVAIGNGTTTGMSADAEWLPAKPGLFLRAQTLTDRFFATEGPGFQPQDCMHDMVEKVQVATATGLSHEATYCRGEGLAPLTAALNKLVSE